MTKVHSAGGEVNGSLLGSRPLRAPHHTISTAGLAGGGSNPRPGEVSLAHLGVLFLDEFPEFGRRTLEVLRQPLGDGHATISRVAATLSYPARVTLVCSMNRARAGTRALPGGPAGAPLARSNATRAASRGHSSTG